MGTVLPESDIKGDLDDSGCVADDISARHQTMMQLLDFSDDVLLQILKFCSPRDLKAVGFTCERLCNLIRDRSLWHDVDVRREPSGNVRINWYLNNVVNIDTKRVRLCGHERRMYGCFHLRSANEEIKDMFNKTTKNAQSKSVDLDPSLCEINTDEEKKETKGKIDIKTLADISKTPPKLVVTPKMLKKLHISCPNLEFIAIEYCKLDCKMSGVSMFPKNLKRLSLRGVQCINAPVEKALLFKIHDYLPDLEYLDLSECAWMEAVGLLPLSKMSSLKALILQHCDKLNEFVAYASLAARYGFLALEVVDLRFTPVSDSEVSAFGWLPQLKELYLQCAETKEDRDEKALRDELPNQDDAYEVLSEWETPNNPESSDSEDDPNEVNPEASPASEQALPLNLSTWNRDDVFVIHNGPTAEVISMPFGPDRAEYRRTIEAIIPQRRFIPRLNHNIDIQRLNAGNVFVRRIQPGAYGREPNINGDRNDDNPRANDGPRQDVGLGEGGEPSRNDGPRPDDGLGEGGEPSRNDGPCQDDGLGEGGEPSRNHGPRQDDGLGEGGEPSKIDGPHKEDGLIEDGGTNKDDVSLKDDGPRKDSGSSKDGGPSKGDDSRKDDDSSKDDDSRGSLNGERPSKRTKTEDNQPGCSRDPIVERPSEGTDSIIELNDNVLVVNLSQGVKRKTEIDVSEESLKRKRIEPDEQQPGPSNRDDNVENGDNSARSESLGPSSSNNDGPSTSSGVANQMNGRENIVVDVPNIAGPSNGSAQNGDAPQQRFVRFRLGDRSNNNIPNRYAIRDFFQRQGSRSVQMVIGHGAGPIRSSSPLFEEQIALVSDSSIRHFGESRLDNAEYVHITSAWRHNNNRTNGRPTRTNLRILSVRGYRQITDRALDHLVTAAPFLVRVDFRETSVTEAGVERFKSLRPEVEVLYTREEKK